MLDNLQHTFPRLAKWCQPCSATLAQQREHTHAHICTIEGQDIKQQQQQQPNRLENCHTRDACAAVQLSQASMIVFRCGCTSHHLLWHACYLCLLAIRTGILAAAKMPLMQCIRQPIRLLQTASSIAGRTSRVCILKDGCSHKFNNSSRNTLSQLCAKSC
jgi:hypothetical protein